MTSRVPRDRGVALPVTLFVIITMTILLAAGFALVGAERDMATGAQKSITALAVAQSGLQRYLATTASRPPEGDSVRYNLAGGYADVVVRIVQKPANLLAPETYIVRSTGYVIVPALGANTQGKRTVAQFAQWQSGVIRQFAAFTPINDISDHSPNKIRIDGTDFCGDSAQKWAVRTRSASDIAIGTYLGRGPDPTVESGTGTWVADTTGVNWSTIVYGPFTPDHGTLITGDTLYHSYLIQGNATLNNAAGTGLLAVTGNLTTRGVARWDGVVLVGGEIFFGASSGDSTAFFGMVVSGLREQIGSAPAAQIGAYPVYIRYDSCKIRRALAPLAGFAPIPSAWVDNWAGY